MRPYRYILNVLLIALALPGLATADLRERVESALAVTNPNLSVKSVQDSPVEGVKEIKLSNGEFLYAEPGSDHIFSGRLLTFTQDSWKDHTEERERQDRAQRLQGVDKGTTITFPATGQEEHEIYVFTDITCPYCKRFHAHMADINERGITVHYLALPRAGIDSSAANNMARIWCTEDPQTAITDVFSGQPLTQEVLPCRSPVADQYTMAQTLGVSGTPSVFASDGRNLGGYMSPDELSAAIANTAGLRN
ncbi:DsbC family protein [Alloalcanivorax profundimaris]|uniref:DsbC family protein n=1 Tax=Alloalcanivorax profundimaris TaxID=2735259 RepID=UPI0018896900|nr:DsbC family protein [Alloalcanivorax profundimaris]MBF1802564.1 DsbC family protein [Alloalcanivorax profundimaris]MCQ6263566.1 DsbC family protein [Alcanivorax sp. MM125-6]